VKRLTFLAVVIAEAFGTLAGRRGFALRFAGVDRKTKESSVKKPDFSLGRAEVEG
jgi:hypothetical protein